LKFVTDIGIIYSIGKRRVRIMTKKYLKIFAITLSLIMFLLVSGLNVVCGEDPPLLGQNINIGSHIG